MKKHIRTNLTLYEQINKCIVTSISIIKFQDYRLLKVMFTERCNANGLIYSKLIICNIN